MGEIEGKYNAQKVGERYNLKFIGQVSKLVYKRHMYCYFWGDFRSLFDASDDGRWINQASS